MADDGSGAKRPLRVDVVTYNVLSPYASAPASHPRCDAAHCDPERRFERVAAKVAEAARDGAILCLQEMTVDWVERLNDRLRELRYGSVAANYGIAKYGNMGVMVAYPEERYVSADFQVQRVAGGQCWPHDKDDASDAVMRAKSALNMVIMMRLTCAASGADFVVCTYHMPCAHRHPVAMRLHAASLLRHTSAFAGDLPLILAGDFNATPDSDAYKAITGTHGDAHPTDGAVLDCCLKPAAVLRSAHVTAVGEEPRRTTHAFIRKAGPPSEFVATVDYVFHSEHFERVEVHPLPDDDGPFPTEHEPSDHLLVRAVLYGRTCEDARE
jgi:endonuclease/exonuclease/phosphatase family metal-dependent hydrolase